MVRTDIHRPGAIVPADYEYRFSYNLFHTVDGWPIPAYNLDLIIKLRQEGHAFVDNYPSPDRCDVCGATFIYGDVWFHVPSQKYVKFGHNCTDKYSMFCDRSEWEGIHGRAVDAAKKAMWRRQVRACLKEIIKARPQLSALLKQNHEVVRDIRARFIEFGSVTEAQEQLLVKIADQIAEEAVDAARNWVEAPNGRVPVEGLVLGTKTEDGPYGTTIKMLVRVETPQGCFKCWGTAPSILFDRMVPAPMFGGKVEPNQGPLRGKRVTFTATFQRSDKDPFFAFFSRPTKAGVV